MRRLLLVLGTTLLVLLVTSVAWLSATETPLPWRGALTRAAWEELARGGLPALACRRTTDGEPRANGLDARLAVSGRFGCESARSDGSYAAALEVREGWVLSMRQSWRVPTLRGRSTLDSMTRALDAQYGPRARCAAEEAPFPARGGTTIVIHWEPSPSVPYGTELRADSVPDIDGGQQRNWRLSIGRGHWRATCPRA